MYKKKKGQSKTNFWKQDVFKIFKCMISVRQIISKITLINNKTTLKITKKNKEM